MQLIILILAAFILGYWFSRSNAASRLSKSAQNLGNRLRQKPEPETVHDPVE
jgi:hypothetical protein